MSVKAILTPNGKTKHQAQVWYGGHFYGSRTFDLETLAKGWHDEQLKLAEEGTLVSPAARKKKKEEDQLAAIALGEKQAFLSMRLIELAEKLEQEQATWRVGKVSKTRIQEIKRAARYTEEFMPEVRLRDFSGPAGALLIKQLTTNFYGCRRTRCGKGRGTSARSAQPSKPLKDQTVRALLTGLSKLLKYADLNQPAGVNFQLPDMKRHEGFGWALPPAHDARTQQWSEGELADILFAAGPSGPIGLLLSVLDESGCRLGEVSKACGHQLTLILGTDNQVVGGELLLTDHKTKHKTQEERHVPLSAVAARLLHQRQQIHGNGSLFPEFNGSDDICKRFAELCTAAHIQDRLLKDLRRGFLNRNKGKVSALDLQKVFGDWSDLDDPNEDDDEGAAVDRVAMGHKRLRTTKGYIQPDVQLMIARFTTTSRYERVMERVRDLQASGKEMPGSKRTRRKQSRAVDAEINWRRASPQIVALAAALGTALSINSYK
ncbi:hypothetical protein ACPWT1_08360 [Ramlibacter sp. MMS24-I3-19]|uniref:hypothetical protein n=1 Tax=Ramlibacter sp. MMS24-I3-19 TaxID=3416606 RepID=UPI003CFFE279